MLKILSMFLTQLNHSSCLLVLYEFNVTFNVITSTLVKTCTISLQRSIPLSITSVQFTYSITKAQLKMLQVTSDKAQQTVTIQCRNVETANNPASFTGFRRGIQLKPRTLSNGCEVDTFGICICVYIMESFWKCSSITIVTLFSIL